MNYSRLLFLIFSLVAFSCEMKTKILLETDEIGYDKVQLFRVNGTRADFLGDFQRIENHEYSIEIYANEAGIYKVLKEEKGERTSHLLILENNDVFVVLNEQSDSLIVTGSLETKKLASINSLLNRCDKMHFSIQRRMVELALEVDSLQLLSKKSENLQKNCLSNLKKLIRQDYSSLASLYAIDFINPEDSLLIDSVFCLSKKRYPNSYLHQEIKQRLLLSEIDICQ